MARTTYGAAKLLEGRHNTVNYVNTKGQTVTAKVIGGAGSVLALAIPHLGANRRNGFTVVAKRTAMTQTNVWF